MLGDRFPSGTEKLEAGARRFFQHADFKEKISDIFHVLFKVLIRVPIMLATFLT
jgi:hypothetical protein